MGFGPLLVREKEKKKKSFFEWDPICVIATMASHVPHNSHEMRLQNDHSLYGLHVTERWHSERF
jgi:hypothetical protein